MKDFDLLDTVQLPDESLEEDELSLEEEESDLLCLCGNMRFIIRLRDGDNIAICPECGEEVDLD